jgi:hypothetical protein
MTDWKVLDINHHASQDELSIRIQSTESGRGIYLHLKTAEAETFAQQLLNNVAVIRKTQENRRKLQTLRDCEGCTIEDCDDCNYDYIAGECIDHCEPNCPNFNPENGDCKESRTPCSRPELNENWKPKESG